LPEEREIMGNYEFDGEKYKKASAHQQEWGNKIISELTFAGTENILDLGCGDGRLTKRLADLVPKGKVVGIDASVGMINTAREIEQPNLSFICLDINKMDFINQFDLIFSNAALHWVKDHQRLLNSCRKALRAEGRIRLSFAGDGNCSNFFEVIRQVIDDAAYREYFKNFVWPWYMPKLSCYEKLVKRQGFREMRVWEENADRYFSSKEDLIKWIDQPTIVPFLELVPDDIKARFRNEVVQRMVDKTINPDGTCFETFRRINVFIRN
jgi:trans-aconitate 2-methyltransferase